MSIYAQQTLGKKNSNQYIIVIQTIKIHRYASYYGWGLYKLFSKIFK